VQKRRKSEGSLYTVNTLGVGIIIYSTGREMKKVKESSQIHADYYIPREQLFTLLNLLQVPPGVYSYIQIAKEMDVPRDRSITFLLYATREVLYCLALWGWTTTKPDDCYFHIIGNRSVVRPLVRTIEKSIPMSKCRVQKLPINETNFQTLYKLYEFRLEIFSQHVVIPEVIKLLLDGNTVIVVRYETCPDRHIWSVKNAIV